MKIAQIPRDRPDIQLTLTWEESFAFITFIEKNPNLVDEFLPSNPDGYPGLMRTIYLELVKIHRG